MVNVDDRIQLRSRLEKLEEQMAKTSGEGGDGDMNSWQQSVENRLSQLHQDIKDLRNFLLLAFAAGFIFIISMFAVGYDKIDTQLEGINATLIKMDTKLSE